MDGEDGEDGAGEVAGKVTNELDSVEMGSANGLLADECIQGEQLGIS